LERSAHLTNILHVAVWASEAVYATLLELLLWFQVMWVMGQNFSDGVVGFKGYP
jgi:hypothetical protein